MSLPYSPAILKDNILFISGQLGVNEKGELISEDVLEQFKQALNNLEKILKQYNFNKRDIVKTTIYITQEEYFDIVNQEFINYFNDYKPTRTTIIVKALPKKAKVEIEAIAIK
ncbi:MAG: RidA family protein [bacterium]|nr:RidA family protein [bacterium]